LLPNYEQKIGITFLKRFRILITFKHILIIENNNTTSNEKLRLQYLRQVLIF